MNPISNFFEKLKKLINYLSEWLKFIVRQIPKNAIAIIMLLIIYLLFWVFPQTKDLLLILNQAKQPWIAVLFFFSSLSVFAFLIGNSNDLSFDSDDLKDSLKALDKKEKTIVEAERNKFSVHASKKGFTQNENEDEFTVRLFTKVLGTILILTVAFAALNLYFEIRDVEPIIGAGKLYGISLMILLLTLNKKISDIINKILVNNTIQDWYSFVLAILLILVILGLGLFNQGGTEKDIFRLFLALLLLAFFYFITTTSYSRFILRFKYRFGAYIILSITLVAFLFYIALIVNPSLSVFFDINPLTTVNACLLSVFSFLMVIKAIGKKREIPLVSVLMAILIVFGVITSKSSGFDHYAVSSVKKNIKYSDRPELKEYIKDWLVARSLEIEKATKENPFEVIFVSSEGGGSRAGLWSFLVNSYLYTQNKDYFENHLFSMTGASGGTVGNSMFFAVANQNFQNAKGISLESNPLENGFNYKASQVFQKDYLSTSLAALMGRDFLKSITNIRSFKDRGELLENEWEERFAEAFNGVVPLDNEFLSYQNPNAKKVAPLLVINTVNLQTGGYSIISPVDFKEDEKNLKVFNDFLLDYDKDSAHRTKTIKYSTAMSLAARFPYVSPVGRVKGIGQFMDAGYYDNIGGTVTRRLYEAFNSVIQTDTTLGINLSNINPVFLLITNDDSKPKKKEDSISYQPQIIAPVVGVLNATFAQVEEMKKTFGEDYLIESKRVSLELDSVTKESLLSPLAVKDKPIKPVLPLGRYLSKTVVRAMEQNLETNKDVKNRLDKLIRELD